MIEWVKMAFPNDGQSFAPRRAAVLIPITAGESPAALLVRRAGHMRRHAGQVGCPGGIVEEADADLIATALRETEEEIGISRHAVHVVRRLNDVYTLNSNFLIAPFVGVVRTPFQLSIDRSEIEEVYEIPLSCILADGAVHYGEEPVGGLRVATWLFDYGSVHVWGATGRILHEMVRVFAEPAARAELYRSIADGPVGVA